MSALDAFAGAGWRARAHTRIRWATAPLAELGALVPRQARVLDVGCGHGLLSIHLALESPDRRVLGVDVDPTKVAEADAAAGRTSLGDRIEFRTIDEHWLPPSASADCVLLVDVLYLLDPGYRERMLRAAAAALRPGGVLVVKEMADAPRWKRRVALAQELVSVRLARLTRGDVVALPTEAQVVEPLRATGFEVTRVDLSARSLHPHVAFVARRPPGPLGPGR